MSNPVFTENAVKTDSSAYTGVPMTIQGVINKTGFLLICLLMSSFYIWRMYFQGYTDKVAMLTVAGFILSIIAFITCMFNRKVLNIAAPVYAVGEGLILGGTTAFIETQYPGIAIQAVGCTFVAFASMLLAYQMKLIRATEKFRSVIIVSTLSIAGIYLIQLIGMFFGKSIPYIFTSSTLGIGFSLLVVAIAALNLILDFDFIEQAYQRGMDKSFEWYGAFGLMVTLVWLYIEILNLLAKLRNK
ncbi:Bax inhibitor-1/YccA family protein [bacterium]|nr:Bax inhibitor-1/YccA family protein [bacterium]